MSTTQTITTAAEIPKVLEQFYLGTGKEGETGYAPGLIGRGISEIFPSKLTGAAAYSELYKPLEQAGLLGRGSVAGLSPFQEAVGTQLGVMSATPGQYALGTQAGQSAASGLQALQNYQSMGVAGPQLTTFQMDPARQFSAAEAQSYMSPYMQAVVDRQQAAALKSAKEAQ